MHPQKNGLSPDPRRRWPPPGWEARVGELLWFGILAYFVVTLAFAALLVAVPSLRDL